MSQIAHTKNYMHLSSVVAELQRGNDQIVLVHGAPGMGKTTCVGHEFVKYNGILVTCVPGISQKALLKMLLFELRSTTKSGTNAELLLEVCELVAQDRRPVFVDEGDFLFSDKRLFESLRTIHDRAKVPVIVVGMSGIAGQPGIDARIRQHPQFADRIDTWVKFEPADLQDMLLLAGIYAPGITLTPDLQQRLLTESSGNIRRIQAGLKRVRKLAKQRGKNTLSAADFGKSETVVPLRQVS